MIVVIVSGVIAVLCFFIWLFCTIAVKSYDKDIINEVNETEVVQQPLNPIEIGYDISSEEVKYFLRYHHIEKRIVEQVIHNTYNQVMVESYLIGNSEFSKKLKSYFHI